MSSATDLYPTRGDKNEILPRRDPVPWRSMANPLPGPLTEPDLRFYGENGFLVIEDFLSPEGVKSYSSYLEKMQRKLSKARAPELVREPGSEELRSIFAVHESDPTFGELARHPRLVAMAAQILQSHVYIHQSRINLKPAMNGEEFQWHSDFETWHAEDGMPRMRAISCAIALTDNHPACGPMLLIPGSHREFVACAGETPERNYETSLRTQKIGVPDLETLRTFADRGGLFAFTGKAGSLLLFDCNTLHASPPNLSPYPRSNLFMVYNSVKNTLVEPFCGREPRPEYIATRKFDPLEWSLVR